MRTIVKTVTKGGHARTTFIPNDTVCKAYMETLVDSGDELLGLKNNVSDEEYLIIKFNTRVDELEDFIHTYHCMSESSTPDPLKTMVRGSLIDAIDSNINIIAGMIRRGLKRGYKLDTERALGLADIWEREDK